MYFLYFIQNEAYALKKKKKRKEKKEIIEVMKFDISKSQNAKFSFYTNYYTLIIIHIKHALPPCQNIKACIRKIKGVKLRKTIGHMAHLTFIL